MEMGSTMKKPKKKKNKKLIYTLPELTFVHKKNIYQAHK